MVPRVKSNFEEVENAWFGLWCHVSRLTLKNLVFIDTFEENS